MKKVERDKIVNIINKDNRSFLFTYISEFNKNKKIKVVFLSTLLEKRINKSILEKVDKKPAIYSNVYSPKDELELFEEVFDNAIKNNIKTHIIGITLKKELDILEKYYTKLGYKRKDTNCFEVDFKKSLVTVSVKIENIIWKGSDYKRMGRKIFFNPPIRDSGQVKAMFSGINKGIIANIYFELINDEYRKFLKKCILEEKILAIALAKLIKYNIEDIGLNGKNNELIIKY